MAFPADRLDVVTELYVGSAWRDITSDVRVASGISITRGAGSEDGRVPPGRCTLTIDNRSGDYSPRNPVGTWYGSLGRNTPIRIGVRQDRDGFGRTVSSGWGSTDTGLAWSRTGAGGSVVNGDWNVTPGAATHSVPAVAAYRLSYLPGAIYRDVEVAVTVQLPSADVTGGDLEPGNILLRGLSSTDYYLVRVVVTAGEAVTVKLIHYDGTEYTDTVTVSGLTHTGQQLRVRAQMEGQTFRAKVWASSGDEPFGWDVTGRVPDEPRAGWVGVRSGVSGSNTNTLPVVVSYDDWEVRRPRYAGEVAEWPPRWDVSATDATAPIEANGILRRLGQGASELQSALRRSIPTAPGLVAYWPLEDDADATQFASALPGVAPMDINGPVELATDDTFAASAPLPVVSLGRWAGRPSYTATGVIQVRWLLSVPSGGATDGALIMRVLTSGTAQRWDVAYTTGGGLRLRAYSSSGATLLDSTTGFALDGSPSRISLEMVEDGSDTDWLLSVLGVGASAGGFQDGTVASVGVGRVLRIEVAPEATLDDVTIGHITVQDEQTSLFDLASELAAFVGESAGDRIERLCEEQGISIAMFGDPTDTAAMGPQGVGTLLDLLQECADSDRGTLHESRGELGLAYRTRTSLYSQAATASIDYSARQLSTPFEPTDDDRGVRNDVTVRRVDGSSERVELETGRMSVLDPADGGIGRYDTSVTVNVETDQQLRDIAGWIMHLGTVDELRVPRVPVNLARVAGSTLASTMLDLDVGDRLAVTDVADLGLYNDVSQIARGYDEEMEPYGHRIAVNCVSASPYDVIELDNSSSRLDSSSSVLDVAATSGAATLSVRSTAERWTTDPAQMPIPITVGGEDMSVTAIGTATPTFVSAGTAAHADNASVSPGLPAGQQAGDLLLILAASRAPTMTPVAPTGYQLLASHEAPLRLFGKISTGAGEVAPTVTYTGSVAGSTTTAQMAAFRGASLEVAATATQTTGTAVQNIAYPLLTLPRGGASLVLWMARKTDDWTSVATISGATEIGEPSSTLGDDMGMVWDYATFDGAAGSVPAGSFVVTGGAAATSRSMVVALYTTQSVTVTRAVNGVVKAHSAGAEVHVSRRATLAL